MFLLRWIKEAWKELFGMNDEAIPEQIFELPPPKNRFMEKWREYRKENIYPGMEWLEVWEKLIEFIEENFQKKPMKGG